MISVDGDNFTNDITALSKWYGRKPEDYGKNEDYRKFCEALNYVNTEIAKMMAETEKVPPHCLKSKSLVQRVRKKQKY